MDRFDKGEDYTAFWDQVLGEHTLSEEDIAFLEKHFQTLSASVALDNPRSSDPIGDFDDDLPF